MAIVSTVNLNMSQRNEFVTLKLSTYVPTSTIEIKANNTTVAVIFSFLNTD